MAYISIALSPYSLTWSHFAPFSVVQDEAANWFVAIDASGSGTISATELQAALTNADWSPFNDETCQLMIGQFFCSNVLSCICIVISFSFLLLLLKK